MPAYLSFVRQISSLYFFQVNISFPPALFAPYQLAWWVETWNFSSMDLICFWMQENNNLLMLYEMTAPWNNTVVFQFSDTALCLYHIQPVPVNCSLDWSKCGDNDSFKHIDVGSYSSCHSPPFIVLSDIMIFDKLQSGNTSVHVIESCITSLPLEFSACPRLLENGALYVILVN